MCLNMPEFAKINWILNMLQVLNIPKFQMWESSEYATIYFFYKQPVYKQLAHRWQIAKYFSGFNPFSLSNNKNYRLRERGFFSM